MNEQELKHALRGAMAATQPPPSMNGAEVLDAARRDRRRRRATMAGVGSAAAVVAIAAGAMIVAAGSGGDSPSGGVGPGSDPTATEIAPAPGMPVPTANATPADPADQPTKTPWPDGQTDRTARQGPRYDKGLQVLDLLSTSLPAGLQAPVDLKPANPQTFAGDLRFHQSQFADEVNGKQIWEYLAWAPVGADGKWGKLLVQVTTPGSAVKGEGCELAKGFWGLGGECTTVDVGGKQVGVASSNDGQDFDQWAGYKHPDGTVVYVAQAREFPMAGLPGLAEAPLTAQQLAELATDPKFRLD